MRWSPDWRGPQLSPLQSDRLLKDQILDPEREITSRETYGILWGRLCQVVGRVSEVVGATTPKPTN